MSKNHHTLTPEDLRFTPPTLAVDEAAAFLQGHWQVDGEFKALAGERDQNFRVTGVDGRRYVYKIASPVEDPSLVDFQTRALLHVERRDPSIPVPRIIRSIDGNPVETLRAASGDRHAVRLLSYVEGAPISGFVPPSVQMAYQVGGLQGRLCRALRDFSHPADTHFMPWDTMNDLVVSEPLRSDYLPDGLRDDCAPLLDRLELDALPRLHALPSQVIHNDAHSGNVLCNPDNPEQITGVIDFGDLVRRPIAMDLATSMTSMIEKSTDPYQACAAISRGFREHAPIPQEQKDLLLDAIVARAVLTVQLLTYRVRNTVTPRSLADKDLPQTIQGLRKVMALDRERFLQAISQ